MKRLLILCAILLGNSVAAEPSYCLDPNPNNCSGSVYGGNWQDNFSDKYGMSVTINGDTGRLECDGPCSTTHTQDGYVITDTRDGDTFEIKCKQCDVTNHRDGSVSVGNAGGFWEHVRLTLGTTGGGVTFPIPGTN